MMNMTQFTNNLFWFKILLVPVISMKLERGWGTIADKKDKKTETKTHLLTLEQSTINS